MKHYFMWILFLLCISGAVCAVVVPYIFGLYWISVVTGISYGVVHLIAFCLFVVIGPFFIDIGRL